MSSSSSSTANDLLWRDICNLMVNVESAKSRAKGKLLQDFFEQNFQRSDMYSVLRLLAAKYDDRLYNLGVSKLAEVYIASLALDKKSSSQANRLKKFGTEKSQKVCHHSFT